MTRTMREMLRGLEVFPAELPDFDVAAAPDEPVPLFTDWLGTAIRSGILGPHAMTLATADAAGEISARVLLCKDVDQGGHWYFASDENSPKGRDLAANPRAAVSFYWPACGRQVRLRGPVATTGAQASAADFLARSPAGRAAALIGHQSQVLDDPADLAEAFRLRADKVAADPGLVAESWTLYALRAEAIEFWQASHERGHTRLRYQRAGDGWRRELLWPLRRRAELR